jgi:hypothetical protein
MEMKMPRAPRRKCQPIDSLFPVNSNHHLLCSTRGREFYQVEKVLDGGVELYNASRMYNLFTAFA